MTTPVLIVDDSLTVRMNLAHAFQAAGFQPILCATAAEARTVQTDQPVDIVILDVDLPDGNGIDLLADIRALPGGDTVVVLMLSSEAAVADRIRGLTTGADDYVGKPYDTKHVVAKSRELLRARGAVVTNPTTVLVIDDSLTFRMELSRVLDQAGYLTITAGTGEEGLLVAASQRPDAVIVDAMLPGIDGAAVIRNLRRDAALRGVPCVLLTGSEDPAIEINSLDAGADAFIRKGDPAIALATLQSALRRATTAPSAASSLLDPKRVLIVTDDPAHLQTIVDSLRGDSFDVIVAESAVQAVRLLQTQTVACVLMDAHLQDSDGDAHRLVKAAPGMLHAPLIMMSSSDDPAAVVDGLAAGADDVIAKTAHGQVVHARIRSQIRRAQFEDEQRQIRENLLTSEREAATANAARELAETRAALVDELERNNEDLRAFNYSVSHDLRNPLQTVVAYSELLIEEQADNLDEQAMGDLRYMFAASRRMTAIIDALLQLSHVNGTELSRQPVDLSTIVHATIDDLQRMYPRPELTFTVEDDVVVDADQPLMRILITNLVGNAWKYTTKISSPHIEFGRVQRGHDAVVTCYVGDNGAGFDSSRSDRLFRPFERLHDHNQFPGTGVGLSTVKRIIDRHGGRIWAHGRPGYGATFYFTLSDDPSLPPVMPAASRDVPDSASEVARQSP